MADPTPPPSPGGEPPKPADTTAKKQTVRISLPPKPTGGPAIKIPSPSAPVGSAQTAVPTPPTPTAVPAAPAGPPPPKPGAGAPPPRPVAPIRAAGSRISGLDVGLAIGAVAAGLWSVFRLVTL